MESFIQDLRIDGKTAEWEDRVVRLLQAKNITSIAHLFTAAQINVNATLEKKFNTGYGMSLNMDVYYFFDLIRDVGSIDRLCAPITGHEDYSHILTFGQKIVLKRYFRTLCADPSSPSPSPSSSSSHSPLSLPVQSTQSQAQPQVQSQITTTPYHQTYQG